MGTPLSKNAESVRLALSQKGLTCKVVELEATTRTATDAAAAIGCEIGQIVKSLLFRTRQKQMPILILVSGKNRVEEKTIEKVIGEKIEKADADFTRRVTGFAIGGIPPVGHKQQIAYAYIDKDILDYDTVWAAAGTPFAVFSLPSAALSKIVNGHIIQLAK